MSNATMQVTKVEAGEYLVNGWLIRKGHFGGWEVGRFDDGEFDWDQTFETKRDCINHVAERSN